MKAAVAALCCVLRVAASASPRAAARPSPIALSTAQRTQLVDGAAPQASAAADRDGRRHDGGGTAAKIRSEAAAAREAAKGRPEPAHRDSGQHARVCFGAAETRETVATHRLSEPIRALRAGRQQGEALRAKLCRTKQDEFVYEIYVLRRDGRIVRLYMNAQNGQAVGSLDDAGHH